MSQEPVEPYSVQLGVNYTGFQNTGMFEENGQQFVQWNPFDMLAAQYGADSPEYCYWTAACGSSYQPQALNVDQFDASFAPQYACLDGGSLSTGTFYGSSPCKTALCDTFFGQMYSTLWHQQTGGVENDCIPNYSPCQPPS